MSSRTRQGIRRHATLLVSGSLVLLLGAVGLLAGRSAGQLAHQVHRDDRTELQVTLAGLTEKYVLVMAGQLQQELAQQGPWSADAGDPRTLQRLRVLAREVPAVDSGFVLVSGTGAPLVGRATRGELPAADDPGWAPLRASVLMGKRTLPVSGVLRAGTADPAVAFGLPARLDDGSLGLVVGIWSLRPSALQEYVSQHDLNQPFAVHVVDHRGLLIAGPRSSDLGKPLEHEQLWTGIEGARADGVLDVEVDGEPTVAIHAGVGSTGWTSLALQDRESFEGALTRSSRTAQGALVALLLIAGAGLVVLHRKREAALETVALRDELTGLYNRRGWLALAEHELERARRSNSSRVLLFVDVDGLKQVNDVLGHREGDRAIADAARVLTAASRCSDVVGRLGGDEFVLLLGDGGQAEVARQRLVDALLQHNAGSRADFELRLSIGAEVWFPDEACSLDELVRRADAVMYVEKESRPLRHEGVLRVPTPRVDDPEREPVSS